MASKSAVKLSCSLSEYISRVVFIFEGIMTCISACLTWLTLASNVMSASLCQCFPCVPNCPPREGERLTQLPQQQLCTTYVENNIFVPWNLANTSVKDILMVYLQNKKFKPSNFFQNRPRWLDHGLLLVIVTIHFWSVVQRAWLDIALLT